MISDIYYGKIKPERLATWETNDDPYDILEDRIRFEQVSGGQFLMEANKILHEETQVDWGSYAYKAKYNELVILKEKLNCEIPQLDTFDRETEFGVVFIEGV